nr:MAG TPA: hypothetical protein [Caudoviricetes sp.]
MAESTPLVSTAGESYEKFTSAIGSYYDSPDAAKIFSDFNQGLIDNSTAYKELSKIGGVTPITNADGSIRDYVVNSDFISYAQSKGYITGTEVGTPLGNVANSNTAGSTYSQAANLQVPSVITKQAGEKDVLNAAVGIGTKSTGEKVIGVLGGIGQAVGAVLSGCQVGKNFDKALYDANPDFWDAHNMSTLDPDTWSSITQDDDSLNATLFNFAMGIQPKKDNPQQYDTRPYMDEKAFAYNIWWMLHGGMFDAPTKEVAKEDIPQGYTNNFPDGIKLGSGNIVMTSGSSADTFTASGEGTIYSIVLQYNNMPQLWPGFISDKIFTTNLGTPTKTANGYYQSGFGFGEPPQYTANQPITTNVVYGSSSKVADAVFGGTITEKGGVAGVSNQPNAVIFDTSGLDKATATLSDVLSALKNQFANLWEEAVTKTVPQEDGSEKTYTYLPMPFPTGLSLTDLQPITDIEYINQEYPQPDPSTLPDHLLELINKLLGKNSTPSDVPPTGGGETTPIVYPTGEASSLWAIYNPTLAQLNSLGAWLWSSAFIDQILKLFSDPMQGLIGLHKVYAQPKIGGTRNIKVGYLDSGVTSKYVSDQYVTIDCGNIDLYEFFGNTMDYAPYTEIKLFLPFIGIVSLDVADVMRSTISVTYGVDVLSGACLANVSVKRDNSGGVLYSFSGDCASHYPLSSGSYQGVVAGILGVATSAVGGFAAGGIGGAVMGGAISAARTLAGGNLTNVQHSGAFSGNAGAMGGKKPYLIISRAQSAMNDGFSGLQGFPSNAFLNLSACKGFTRVSAVHVENIPNATKEEKAEIETLLKSGVIIR